jgi:hypothetical protein
LRRSALLRRWRDSPLGQRLAWRIRARVAGYEPARQARLVERRQLYPAVPGAGAFSLVTPVWNTDPGFLRTLADSVLAQDVLSRDSDSPFEWLIHDNASTDSGTRDCLAELARHPVVRLTRTPDNLGIIGGLRHGLERATGRYVLPLDHDDYLYPDALRIVAWQLAEHDYPAMLYSDEDKLYGTRHCYPYFKPDWDPVLFVNAAYIAHLCAFDRAQALAHGVWSDRRYEGCHDWDAAMRLWQAGHVPAHAPEVLYGWRIHAGSTSGNIGAKDFIVESQRALLERFVASRASPERYAVEPNRLFPGTPNWHIRRLETTPRPITTVVLGDPASPAAAQRRGDSRYPAQDWHAVALDASVDALLPIAAAAQRAGALLRLLWDAVAPIPPTQYDAMLWEALGLFELFPDTAMVGGRVADAHNRVRSAGGYFGYGTGCDSPDLGRDLDDPGYQAQAWQQHTVSAVSSELAVLDPALLIATIEAHRDVALGFAYLGAWCGAQARRDGRRVIYSPFVAGHSATPWAARVGDAERAAFRARHGDLMPDDALWSPRHSRV